MSELLGALGPTFRELDVLSRHIGLPLPSSTRLTSLIGRRVLHIAHLAEIDIHAPGKRKVQEERNFHPLNYTTHVCLLWVQLGELSRRSLMFRRGIERTETVVLPNDEMGCLAGEVLAQTPVWEHYLIEGKHPSFT